MGTAGMGAVPMTLGDLTPDYVDASTPSAGKSTDLAVDMAR